MKVNISGLLSRLLSGLLKKPLVNLVYYAAEFICLLMVFVLVMIALPVILIEWAYNEKTKQKGGNCD